MADGGRLHAKFPDHAEIAEMDAGELGFRHILPILAADAKATDPRYRYTFSLQDFMESLPFGGAPGAVGWHPSSKADVRLSVSEAFAFLQREGFIVWSGMSRDMGEMALTRRAKTDLAAAGIDSSPS